ncbi:RNA polymerase sigma factor [Planctomycetota bacterium]
MNQAVKVNVDDRILVEQCRQGNSTAAEHLIIKYQNRIYNVILKICRNSDDAAELTQDTFVKIIQNIDKFEGRSSFYTWAFRIAVNLTLNYCKKSVNPRLRSIDAEYYENPKYTKQTLKALLKDETLPDPAVVAANKELAGIIINAVWKLDDAHRAVVVLRDIEGMNYKQIAQILEINLGTVKSRLSRARSDLRKILEAASK